MEQDLFAAWTALSTDWLNLLIAALPAGYSRAESQNFLVVSALDQASGARLISHCEHALRVVAKTLEGVARDDWFGKHVVLAFADHDRYYDYVLDFYPDEGEFATSGGMYLDDGYRHVVLNLAYYGQHDRIIAHEVCHNLIGHLPLPMWLDEGVTQVLEDIVVESSYFEINREIVALHLEYWDAETIQLFWSGDSFYTPEGQELSYHLAQVLFRNLMSDYPRAIVPFLASATNNDAGDSALREACGVSLSDRVAQFLGEGDWGPRV